MDKIVSVLGEGDVYIGRICRLVREAKVRGDTPAATMLELALHRDESNVVVQMATAYAVKCWADYGLAKNS